MDLATTQATRELLIQSQQAFNEDSRGCSNSENSRRLWLSDIPCWKSFPANFDAAGKFCTDFRQHDMLSLPRFGHFPARKMAAGKSAPPFLELADFSAGASGSPIEPQSASSDRDRNLNHHAVGHENRIYSFE